MVERAVLSLILENSLIDSIMACRFAACASERAGPFANEAAIAS